MPHQTWIADACRRWLTTEEYDGWRIRGDDNLNPGGLVCHWTAGPRGATGRPSLNSVVNGRPDLAGPLANVYLDRAGIAVVVAAGRANHAGEGGWKGLTGNSTVLGIEAEAAGDDDWTRQQLDAYPRLCAALLSGINRDPSWCCGHNEWAPDRKIDIRDWPMSLLRSQIVQLLSQTPTLSTLTEVGMFLVFGPGGAALAGAGYWKNLDGEEYDRLAAVPGMVVQSVDQRGWDIIGSACMNGTSAPIER